MANIKEHRIANTYSAKRLRRARRLYFYLAAQHIPTGPEGVAMVNYIARRLQDVGMYAKSTQRSDIKFACYRYMYQTDIKIDRDIKLIRRDQGWYSWLIRKGYGRSPWFETRPMYKKRIRM